MKKFLSALLLLSLLVGVLCACNPFYDPEQAALDELCRHYNDEFKAYPSLYTPKKNPSALENYDALYSSAQAAADSGKLSLKHYLIPEKITERDPDRNEIVYLTARLTKADFENEEQFFNARLYQQILLDSFGTSAQEFLEKTQAMTKKECAAYTEERLQMLKHVAAQSGKLFDSISYSFEEALCDASDTFCCYDLLLRAEFKRRYPVSTVSLAKSEEEQADWEFFKQCYDEYTAGADARTVYDKLIREQQELKKSYEE